MKESANIDFEHWRPVPWLLETKTNAWTESVEQAVSELGRVLHCTQCCRAGGSPCTSAALTTSVWPQREETDAEVKADSALISSFRISIKVWSVEHLTLSSCTSGSATSTLHRRRILP